MDRDSRWIFSKDMMDNRPSMKVDKDPNRELFFRQKAGTFIQKLGLKLQLSEFCICSAIVYMHRFYMFNSFEDVDAKKLATAAIFAAAKALNEYRKLEHVIKVAHAYINRNSPHLDVKSEMYLQLREEIMFLETVLLQTLGFDLHVEHPHQYVVKICQLIQGSEELARKSYLLATASIMLSVLCLQYSPMTVACVCINLAARGTRLTIKSDTNRPAWFNYVDQSLTAKSLTELTDGLKSILRRSKAASSTEPNCVEGKTLIEKSFPNAKGTAVSAKRNYTNRPLPMFYAYSSAHPPFRKLCARKIMVKISKSLVTVNEQMNFLQRTNELLSNEVE